MNSDIRLHVGFWDHPKVVKLIRRINEHAAVSWQKLLLWAAMHRPDGILHGMDAESIAVAARWDGDADQFHQTLSELILIERSDDGHTVIHDWNDYNAWQAGAPGRVANARNLNHKRWYEDRKRACGDLACSTCKTLRSTSESVSISGGISSESITESSSRFVTSPKKERGKRTRTNRSETPVTEETLPEREAIAIASELGYAAAFARRVRDALIDGCAAKGYSYKDHRAAFRQWLRREERDHPASAAGSSRTAGSRPLPLETNQ
jgi:hypothetical protein